MSLEQSGPSRRALLAAAALLPLAGCRAESPAGATKIAARTAPTSAQDHYDRAVRLAGDDPVLQNLVRALRPGAVMPPVKAPEPLRIFDDVAVVSTGFVSATALLTSGGVILVDALGSPDEAENTLVPGLRAVGVDPSKIKYVVAAHGHSDHYGGARYLADRYGARVMMSPADWDLVAGEADAPTRDLEIADGQRLTLGDTTVVLHHTPGHTPGTVSPIFPVRWKGRRHTAMLWGGTNPPAATAEKRTYVSSVLAFAARMRQAGADVELNNHGTCDQGLARMEELRSGGPANPFIIGHARAQRFMKVMETMLRGRIATDEEKSASAHPVALASVRSAPACC
ncbi:MBL fold metallo-hydrolase [Spirillospora sp. CA-128828]|uniref:MBL fold metallo-hydrolase n=1 Tax=Spirillospora sp. CA-128828 TaxID=3240033 RepID=UPI003D8F2AB3